VLIIRTDSQGKEIWRKVIGTEEKDDVISTLCVINGAVMLAGVRMKKTCVLYTSSSWHEHPKTKKRECTPGKIF
jgi:hypothetical protein